MSTLDHAAGGEFTRRIRDRLRPHILADLDSQEHCSAEQLLGTLLERCRDPPPSLDPLPRSDHSGASGPAPSTPHILSTEDSPYRLPSSTYTVRQPKYRLLQTCLAEMIPLCEDLEIQRQLTAYKNAGTGECRHGPFVKFANRALQILAPLQPAGIRPPSELKVLFKVNGPKWDIGSQEPIPTPDIVILSLSNASQVHGDPHCVWNHIIDRYSPIYPNNRELEWPDILAPVDLNWDCIPVRSEMSANYDSKLETRIEPLSILRGQNESTDAPSHDFAKVMDTSTNSSATASSDSVYNLVDAGDLETILDPAQKLNKLEETHNDVEKAGEEAMVQSAINGAKMLRCSLGRPHSLGLVIIDATVWVWRYGRQSAIQSSGIDFIKNLPHFLVLLLALQRFTLADWGFNEELDPSMISRLLLPDQTSGVSPSSAGDAQRGLGSFTINRQSITNVQTTVTKLKIDTNPRIRYDAPVQKSLHHSFCIKGRSTSVFPMMAKDTPPQAYEAKLYWPNHHRLKEEEVITRVRSISSDLHGHPPLVLSSRDIDQIGTLGIRQESGISYRQPSRGLRKIVFESLEPITDLTGNDFVVAFVKCIRCHYILWNTKIFHQDLSPKNLMVWRKGGRIYGVLNDWDLSHSEGQVEPMDRVVGTVPFMAFGLVRAREAQEVIRLYYFDLESFFWIIMWIFRAFKDRRFDPMPSVIDWQTSNMVQSSQTRGSLFFFPDNYRPHPEWLPYWDMARDLTKWVQPRALETDKHETPQKNREVLRSMLEVIAARFTGEMPKTPPIEGLDM